MGQPAEYSDELRIMYLSREPLHARHGGGKVAEQLFWDMSRRGHQVLLVGLGDLKQLQERRGGAVTTEWRGLLPVRVWRHGNLRAVSPRIGGPVVAVFFAGVALVWSAFFVLFSRRTLTKILSVVEWLQFKLLARIVRAETQRTPAQPPYDVIVNDCHPRAVALSTSTSRSAATVGMFQVPYFVPFGPCSPEKYREDARILRPYQELSAFLTFGEYPASLVAEAFAQRIPVGRICFPASVFGKNSRPRQYKNFDAQYVAMVNPCSLKGIDIFCGIASALPDVSFAAVPSWGTTKRDLRRLSHIGNVDILRFFEDVEELYAQVKLLLVPSVGPEFFGLVVVEAMARGIPVIASEYAGVRDAKMGVDYNIPIVPMRFPDMKVPEQDIEPWCHAIVSATTDCKRYQDLSEQSRAAALAYLDRCEHAGAEFEAFLRERVRDHRD